jgi:hypothetical protein
VKNSKENWKGVKKLWKFHHSFQWKMSEKQTTFFTVNYAGKIESANQWDITWNERVNCSNNILTNLQLHIY